MLVRNTTSNIISKHKT